MRSYVDPLRYGVVVEFEARDRVGALRERFTQEEWAQIGPLFVAHEDDRRARYFQRSFTLIEEHVDAHERRCFFQRPGGWDANGAPV